MATTQLFLASTLYGAATLAAAMDAGAIRPADRRILVVCNNASVPETNPSLDQAPGFEPLRGRFDRLVSWNAFVHPLHPGGWTPRTNEVPLWERHLRMLWDLGDDDVELIVESLQVPPALSAAQVFLDAPITVYADGLMSYGPTRNKLGLLVDTRIDKLLHLDLVPGLEPMLLTEFGVPSEVVPGSAFTKVLAEVAAAADDSEVEALDRMPADSALLLGQYLSALNILSTAEEEELHLSMVRGAVALGHRQIVFKPHPTAPAHWLEPLKVEAARLGAELTVLDTPVLAEVVYQKMRPALVVGCFSTALLTASVLYDIPVARTGTRLLLERLTPYQNSNRIPVTIVHAMLPDLGDPAAVRAWAPPSPRSVAADLTPLLHTVGYCMQSKAHPGLRDEAVAWLSAHLTAETWPYFKRRRLTTLGMPGAIPARLAFVPRNRTVRRVARRARALKKATIG
ncbi:alpha-2,8-polysialyltransferase family protein [Actinacidiphila acidipaludis]|uniref:Alpha-2,8-polysialyltransferase family protein n=1 Tax=Actinacidiphila acidipaludis TaxID=2873382 RepID=A0ABS7QFG3_9ACTN|nr:alpha-2,8-polysialyltransferase family protein [Streptomyces acidipaludis]MBY8881905.1 alpha-2,8-polysialyltransferase family protein [Streptomyces acidipaludis]